MRDLAGLPKAHLHVHLESTVRAGTLAEFADAHDRSLPTRTVNFLDFTAFSDHNALIRDCLRTPADFHRVAVELCADEAAQGTRHLEATFTAASHGERLGDPEALLEAVLAGLSDGAAAAGITARLILDHPRRRSVHRAEQTLRLARRYAADGVVAIGLAGNEAYPVAPFVDVCTAARDAGIGLVHHAGESRGPDSIRAALTTGRADRIGHGITALDDPDLVAELRDRRIALEVCPSSNLALGLVPSWAAHPLPRMRAAGLVVTLHTDVPDVTGTTLTDEYEHARHFYGWDDKVLADLAHASVDASFAPGDVKHRIHLDIAAWLADAAGPTVGTAPEGPPDGLMTELRNRAIVSPTGRGDCRTETP